MYYRYEGKKYNEENWEGIFSFLNPSERGYFNRFLREPKWYEKNADLDSKCWFTEEGYNKYHQVLDDILDGMFRGCFPFEFRIVTKEKLDNIACKGKIQCIELV